QEFPIRRMCKVLRVSHSGFYDWLRDPCGVRGREDEAFCEDIRRIFKDSKDAYGNRRIRRALRKMDKRCSRSRIRRLMKRLELCPKRRRRFRVTTNSKHPFEVHPNLLARDFRVMGPNQVWVSDITYIWTGEGWLYLETVIDLFSRKVVGWSMSESLKATTALDALQMAIAARNPAPGLIHHSDQGVQYACGDYQKSINRVGMVPSMSRKGDCWDNSVAESFFSTLKKELVWRTKYETREQARRELFEFIEVFYNRQRMHSYLGYLSPAEFESAAATVA
ncbi:MAG TPA: IS3 family transposase, partial [Armatimonadota bacterium]|nr:IS3 family transposase [Armatimonadota bacterium]